MQISLCMLALTVWGRHAAHGHHTRQPCQLPILASLTSLLRDVVYAVHGSISCVLKLSNFEM